MRVAALRFNASWLDARYADGNDPFADLLFDWIRDYWPHGYTVERRDGVIRLSRR